MARVERKGSGTFQALALTGLHGSDQPVVPRRAPAGIGDRAIAPATSNEPGSDLLDAV
jgi:hypothetical protein